MSGGEISAAGTNVVVMRVGDDEHAEVDDVTAIVDCGAKREDNSPLLLLLAVCVFVKVGGGKGEGKLEPVIFTPLAITVALELIEEDEDAGKKKLV